MLLVGAHLNADAATATRVLVDQDFSHLKKHYRLLSVRRYPALSRATDIEADLERIYSDRRYTGRKRLFSQDGRPSKTIRSHPKLIVHSTSGGTATVDALRGRKIPVEGIFLDGGREWRQADAGKGLGRNYHVSADAVEAVLSRVIAEQRLSCEDRIDLIPGTGPSAETRVKKPEADEGTLRKALAAAVWFRETIKYTRAYRA